MGVRFIEVRSGDWNLAADDVIQCLTSRGVQQNQLLWIDAHNNGPNEEAIMSAYWDHNIKGEGPLDISYYGQNNTFPWPDLYTNASIFVSNMHPKNLVSITASCNCNGKGVLYVFYYNTSCPTLPQNIRWCEARAGSWNKAAEKLNATMENSGAKAGQIVGIDAHNNSPDGDAIFSAWWNLSLPATGDQSNTIAYNARNDTASWNDHYSWASDIVAAQTKNAKSHAITSSCNEIGNRVTYLFKY